MSSERTAAELGKVKRAKGEEEEVIENNLYATKQAEVKRAKGEEEEVIENNLYATKQAEFEEERRDAAALLEQVKLAQQQARVESLESLSQEDTSSSFIKITSVFTGYLGFILKELQVKRLRIDSNLEKEKENFYELSSNLFGGATEQKIIYIRESYHEMKDKVLRLLNDNKTVMITGTPGCGTSIFGMMMVFELLQIEKIVIYQHKGVKLLLVDVDVTAEQLERLNKFVSSFDFGIKFRYITKPGVYQFDYSQTTWFKNLCGSDFMTVVQDLGEDITAEISRIGSAKKLILLPLNDERFRVYYQSPEYRLLYMPIWSLKELLAAGEKCFPNKNPTLIKQEFEKYGGTPRYVLEFDPEGAKLNFDRQIRELKGSQVNDIVNTSSYLVIPRQQYSDMVLHVIPTDLDYDCIFASRFILRKIADKFVFNNASFNRKAVLNESAGAFAFSQFRGFVLEELAHCQLTSGHFRGNINRLLSARARKPNKNKAFEVFIGERVSFEEEIPDKIKVGFYYQGKPSLTLDSFAVFNQKLMKQYFPHIKLPTRKNKLEIDSIFLVYFQVTISKITIVDDTVLNRVRERVEQKLNGCYCCIRDHYGRDFSYN